MTEINFTNFYISTFANFIPCDKPDIDPTYYSFSGSSYWNLGNRVIRWSDHWGMVSSCVWLLDGKQPNIYKSLSGECFYKDFNKSRFYQEWLWKDMF
jgi:hypothetical protein